MPKDIKSCTPASVGVFFVFLYTTLQGFGNLEGLPNISR